MTLYKTAIRAVEGDAAARTRLSENAVRDGRATVIATDFDGTLCISDYPDILAPCEKVLAAVRMMQAMGYEFILWTCRECDDLDDAVAWLKEQGIQFDTINDNAPSIKELFGGYNSRKINADEYWDDKAVRVTAKEPL